MKNTLILIGLFSLLLAGCEYHPVTTFKIDNQTSDDLLLRLYKATPDSLLLKNKSVTVIGVMEGFGSNSPAYIDYAEYDSIQIIEAASEHVYRTYLPESPGKNIYNSQDKEVWLHTKTGKYEHDLVFEITPSDLQQ